MADEPTATATLTVTKPGKRADAVVESLGKLVDVKPTRAKDTHTLTFHHADPRNALGVVAAHLRQSKLHDWEEHVSVVVKGAGSGPWVV